MTGDSPAFQPDVNNAPPRVAPLVFLAQSREKQGGHYPGTNGSVRPTQPFLSAGHVDPLRTAGGLWSFVGPDRRPAVVICEKGGWPGWMTCPSDVCYYCVGYALW